MDLDRTIKVRFINDSIDEVGFTYKRVVGCSETNDVLIHHGST